MQLTNLCFLSSTDFQGDCSTDTLSYINNKVYKGPFNNYVDRILRFFDPRLRGQFLCPERGQKQTFFDPLPPSSCPRSY